MIHFSPRIRLFSRFLLFHWIVFFLFRLAFYFTFSDTSVALGHKELLEALYLGAKFDFRAAGWLIMPLILLSFLPKIDIKKNKKLWLEIYSFLAVIWLMVYVADFGYYAYLNTRINASFISFFYNPLISTKMVWENYPVIKGVLAIFLFMYVYRNLLSRYIFSQSFFPIHKKSLGNILGILVFSVLLLGGMYGNWGYYPLRWSEAFFSTKPFASALAVNPNLYFATTYRHRKLNFDRNIVKKNYEQISKYLRVDEPNKEDLNFIRNFSAHSKISFKPNIVLIVMESFAAYKTSLMNNPLDGGPNFSAIANEGVLFSEYYVPVEGTARSIFAIMTGVPDLSKEKTASRNPLIVDQNLIMNAFKGYRKMYFLGGSANWGNIRGIFSNNVSDIEIVEEGEYSEGRTDVWGLSDYHLFKEANKRLSKTDREKPFFAIIQSSSYHRPYTIPEDNGGFQYLEKSEQELKNAGFISNEEYNSFRFADHSLGVFFEQAKKESWFEDTLFVITGDHGVPDNHAEFQEKARRELETAPFHVPLVFYNKKIFPKAERIEKVATEMDVFPSIAGLLGVEYYNSAMGRDLFDESYDSDRFALTYTYHRPGEYGLIGKSHYLKVKPNSRGLYSLAKDSNLEDLKEIKPELFKEMSDLADGLLETGRYMLHNNKSPKKLESTPKDQQ